jgi:Ca2+-binding EF-hand superfamily protein
MRSLGLFKIDEAELQAIIMEVDSSGKGCVDFVQFLDCMASSRIVTESAKQLKEAFGILDKDQKGFNTAEDLRPILSDSGWKVSKEDTKTR